MFCYPLTRNPRYKRSREVSQAGYPSTPDWPDPPLNFPLGSSQSREAFVSHPERLWVFGFLSGCHTDPDLFALLRFVYLSPPQTGSDRLYFCLVYNRPCGVRAHADFAHAFVHWSIGGLVVVDFRSIPFAFRFAYFISFSRRKVTT